MNNTIIRIAMLVMAISALMFARERVDVGHTTLFKAINNAQVGELSSHATPDESIDRDEIIIYSDDFEGESTWMGAGWELTDSDYNSETHS